MRPGPRARRTCFLSAVVAVAVAIGCVLPIVHGSEAAFHEELLLTPLGNHTLMAHAAFTTRVPPTFNFNDFDLFPKALGQVLLHYKVEQLRLTFGTGRWDYDRWGYPVMPVAMGLEVSATFHSSVAIDSIDDAWIGLTKALSGLTCASVHFMADPNVVSQPTYSLCAEGGHNVASHIPSPWLTPDDFDRVGTPVAPSHSRRAILSREPTGFGQLLRSVKLYRSQYHSMTLHFRPIVTTEGRNMFELSQTVTVVQPTAFDGIARDKNGHVSKHLWTLKKMFGAPKIEPCAVATTSRIYVRVPGGRASGHMVLNPSPTHWSNDDTLAVYDLTRNGGVEDMSITVDTVAVDGTPGLDASPLRVSRHVTGWGQAWGGLVGTMENVGTSPLRLLWSDAMPWYFGVFWHTLCLERNGVPLSAEETAAAVLHVRPAERDTLRSSLELGLALAPGDVVTFSVRFMKQHLPLTDHPPDAHRGFDVAPALVVALVPLGADGPGPAAEAWGNSLRFTGLEWSPVLWPTRAATGGFRGHRVVTMYTDPSLVMMPTPDFSMPYNVITLSSTVLGFFFGAILGALMSDVSELSSGKPVTSKRPIVRFLKWASGLVVAREEAAAASDTDGPDVQGADMDTSS